MKLVLIGHCCFDVFRAGSADAVTRTGGILLPARVLGELAAPGDIVVPVCGVGAADHPAVLEELSAVPAVSTAGVFTLPGATPSVFHTAGPDGPGVTCAREVAPPISFDRIRKHLAGADGILVNMMSGSDIALDTLDLVRMEIRARGVPVVLDYHNLTRGVNDRFERFRRPLPEWRRWAFMNDIVQANEEEMGMFGAGSDTEGVVAGHLLTLGVRAAVVTRGAGGATVYTSEQKKVRRHDIPPAAPGLAAHVPGMGDIFGAAMLRRYAGDRDPLAAAAFAAATAARHLADRAALTGVTAAVAGPPDGSRR